MFLPRSSTLQQRRLPKFGAVLRQLRNIHKDLFANSATLQEMRPHYLQRLQDMQAKVVRAEKESSLLLEAAEVLEREALQHHQEKESMARSFEAQRAELERGKLRWGLVKEKSASIQLRLSSSYGCSCKQEKISMVALVDLLAPQRKFAVASNLFHPHLLSNAARPHQMQHLEVELLVHHLDPEGHPRAQADAPARSITRSSSRISS